MRIAPFPAVILMALAPLAQAQTAAPAVAPAPTAAAAKPLAVVNGKEIPALYGELVKSEMLSQGQPDSPQLDARVRDSVINLELLSRAAIDKGLDKDPRLTAAMDIRRKDQLTKVYLEDYIRTHPITDAEIQAVYDEAKAAAANDTEYRARHILVKTEAEAKKLIAELGKKAKFEDLAKKHSQDPGSAKNGGDLNWADPRNFVKEFADALTKLKKGEYTKVAVKTQFGWHIIRLDDTRKVQVPELESVRSDIVKQLQQKRIREAVSAARAGAKIE